MKNDQKATILNVDVDDSGRYAVTRILRMAGFDVREASNGRDALQLAEEQPDLILLDVNLPDIGGFDVCMIIKNNPITSHIPVLHLSATYMDDESKVRGLEIADGYLTQPVGPQVLISTIKALLRMKRAEKELRESEEHYRILFDEALDGICLADAETGIIMNCNQALAALVARERAELIGRPQKILHPPQDDQETVSPTFKQHLVDKQGQILETQVVTRQGDIREVEIKANLLDIRGRKLLQGIFRDITERKRVEEMLRESEERFKAQYQGSPSPTFTWKKQGEDFVLIDFNDAARAITDGKVGEFVGRKATELYPDRQELLRDFRRCYDQREVIRRETRFEHFVPGRLVVVTFAFVPPDLILVHLEDITDRRQVEEEKDKLQTQLANAMEIAHLGHWEYDVINDIFTFNDHFYKMFRTTAEHVGGYNMSSAEYARRFVPPDEIFMVREEIRKSIEAVDSSVNQESEHRILYGDGTVGHITVKIFIVKDAHGKTVKTYGVNQDITERKKMEEELLKVQKLESVGILAGGIAHDFNNILTVILGYASLAKMRVSHEDEIFGMLSEVEKASVRAQTLTKQLLTFAKGGLPVKETASIKDIVKESSLFVLRGSKSSCEFSIAKDLWSAEVDVGQISQVISNIMINANQAMPEGGIIQVAAENLIIDVGHILPLKPGRYIRISIIDQGAGIAEKHLSKVFDPYFTTKQEGSGLGLSTTYSIIKKHDGYITVKSELGVGTTFHIYLPASEKAVPKIKKTRLIKGHGRILVMDDEESLRKMIGRMLKNLGYESKFAKDGAEAIQMYKAARKSGKPYDAVILDLTVPGGMGGKDTVKKLLKIDPEIKAIVSSGYSDDPVLSNFQEYGFKGMMPKPFESRLLSKVLHEVLQGGKG